jgi:hypothetical protein
MIVALLGAGGGYALASGGGGQTIHACVHKHGGDIYVAKKCAKHDKKISWNKQGPQGIQGIQGQTGNTGPQGPGATSLEYNATGSASPTPAPIGNMGPYALSGTCTTTGSGASAQTEFDVTVSGPGVLIDGLNVGDTATGAESLALAGPLTNAFFDSAGPATGQSVESATALLFPTGGSPFEITPTLAAFGGSPPAGAAADTCHFSMVITPVAAPAAAVAHSHAPVTKLSGPILGRR